MKCCERYYWPRVKLRASPVDLIGLGVFLILFFSVLAGISYLIVSIIWASIEEGTFLQRRWVYGIGVREGVTPIVILFCMYCSLPKFLHVCSFFVNYKIRVSTLCKECGKEKVKFIAPSENEPF